MKKACLISVAIVLLVSSISMSCGNGATPPAAPIGLTCQWFSSSQIDLSWDASSGADGYNVYRCTGASCTPTTSVRREATTSWSDTGLTANTTYCYRLTAYNEVGESGYSSIASCTTYDPATAWDKTFGGSNNDHGHSVQQTSDGGYVIAGTTHSYGAGNGDVWLIETDPSGNMAWNKTFGGSGNDYGHSVRETSDGGYVIAGSTDSYGVESGDVWLIKADSSGNLTWSKTFGGPGEDHGYSVQQTSDGGYIIAGSTDSYGAGNDDVWLVKTDSSGDAAWNKTFGGSSGDYGNSVQQTPDGGYVIAGTTYSYGAGSADVWMIKTDSSGNMAWNKTFGSPLHDHGSSADRTSDGGYVIAGWTDSYGAGNYDVWLIKADSSGNAAWNKTLGGWNSDYGWSVQQTSDGGYIIAGYTGSYGAGNDDVWLVKTDSSGDAAWNKTLGGTDSDYGWSVQQTSDGGYIIAGYTGSYGAGGYDIWLIKVTA